MQPAISLEDIADLPGHDLVLEGLDDLRGGRLTRAALLVAEAAPRLRGDGVMIPEPLPPDAKDQLWETLEREVGDDAHRLYNALLGRVLSFAAALEAVQSARLRASGAASS